MDSPLLDNIKGILIRLDATGSKGFEGLVGQIIYGITGIPSKLARSGTQFGIDGSAAFPSDVICFETKLYKTALNKDQINSKVFVLSNHKNEPDLLWVLGATVPVPSQEDDLLRKAAFKDGISVLVLDWSDQSLPTLALSLAMAKDRAVPWIADALDDESIHESLSDALNWVTEQKDYSALAEKLFNEFNAIDLATTNAEHANKEWLNKALAEEKKARSQFGQPIIPLNNPNMTLERADLFNQINQRLGERKTIFLLGDEGCGKSWIAASAMKEFSGLSIFISAERLEKQLTEEGVRDLVIKTLATQCGQSSAEFNQKRWLSRLDGWGSSKKTERLLIVLDGLNQRPDLPWDRIIFWLQNVIAPFEGHLIISTRKRLFQSKIKAGLIDEFSTIQIGNWSEDERDELLRRYKVQASELDSTTAKSLLNPRLLGIAIATLPHDNIEAWQGLTTDRLLFEHLRLSQRDNIEPYTASELAKRLSEHANKILEQLANGGNKLEFQIFQSDTGTVAEGLFFEALPGPNHHYRLKDDGLTLALGYALVDRIWDQSKIEDDLDEILAILLDPVSSLDRTVEIVLASLTICVYDDERFGKEVLSALLLGFANLQNPSTLSYISFKECCFQKFGAFLSVFENSVIDEIDWLNSDWFEEVVKDSKNIDFLWPTLVKSIHRWLSFYTRDPEHDLWVPDRNDQNQRAKALQKKTTEIEQNISSLSPFEIELLEEMEERHGNIEGLAGFAMELLVGKPLAPFARSFMKWGVSYGINSSSLNLSSSFSYLTNFNQVDWSEMSVEFRRSVDQLKNTATSKAGLWTVVRMLYATGLHEDAVQAKKIALELRRNDSGFEGWRLIESYCATDPCDPSSKKPDNIRVTGNRLREIPVEEISCGRGSFEHDHFRQDALTGLVRFYPGVALSKHKELLTHLPKRSGDCYRQLSISGWYLAPLMSQVIARDIVEGLKDGFNLQNIPKKDHYHIGMYALKPALRYLSPAKQLEVMSLPVFEGSYFLDVTPHLKPLVGSDFTDKFVKILMSEVKESIVPVLAFMQYTDTEIADELIEFLLPLMFHSSLNIRVAVFGVILKRNITSGFEFHCKSDWRFDLDGMNSYEAWYGSWILVEATKLGFCSISDVFERCSLEVWVKSLASLEAEAQQMIIEVMDNAFCLLAGSPIHSKPFFDVSIQEPDYSEPPHYSLESLQKTDGPKRTIRDVMEHMNETDDEFLGRHKKLREAFDRFKSSLDKNVAIWILSRLEKIDLANINKLDSKIVERWMRSLLSSATENIFFEKNLYCLIATTCSEKFPREANELFRKVVFSKGFATVTYSNGLTADHFAIWESGRSQVLESLRTDRLNATKNDHLIALEVFAAEKCGRDDFIRSYVNENISSDHPYLQSRAIMVAGYSDQTKYFESLLKLKALESGLAGDTAKVALEAHKRCCWSKHWASVMIEAKNKEEFWCAAQLLVKIVDARIGLFLEESKGLGLYWESYNQELQKGIKKRTDKWKTKRKETLFGIKGIDEIFIT